MIVVRIAVGALVMDVHATFRHLPASWIVVAVDVIFLVVAGECGRVVTRIAELVLAFVATFRWLPGRSFLLSSLRASVPARAQCDVVAWSNFVHLYVMLVNHKRKF